MISGNAWDRPSAPFVPEESAPKPYLWDWSAIDDEGSRFENLFAGHLLTMCHLLEDREGYRIGLHYLHDVSKREVDFLVSVDKKPWFAVECKVSGHSENPSLPPLFR